MILYVDAKYSHLDDILDNLSGVSAQELVNFGVENRWQALKRLRQSMKTGKSLVCLKDGRPLFYFGYVTVGSTIYTHFVGTEEFFQPKIEMIRLGKKFMWDFAKARPFAVIEAHSRSSHPAVAKWFKSMGFARCGEVDGSVNFVYDRPFRKETAPTAA